MFYLTALEGSYKGRTWSVDSAGLLLGRSASCDISLEDRSVSRRQCRIFLQDGDVRLEDLGSSNPTLVNGQPARGNALHAGDHIGLGGALFLLSGGISPLPSSESERPGDETYPVLSDGRAVYLDADPETLWLRERPRTVHDLIRLYDTTRELGEAADRRDFLVRLEARLRERFGEVEFWVARANDDTGSGFSFCPATAAAAVPVEAVRAALREKQGLLVPSTRREDGRRVRKVTLAAPMPFGGVTTAVLAVRMTPASDASHTADLGFLVLLARLLAPLVHALDRTEQLQMENERLRARAGESQSMVGESPAIQEVLGAIRTAARSSLNVLVTGETGTGKELAARMLHGQSSRHDRPLVVVNCAAIPKDLFESELFGHTEGAFTGASRASAGLLSRADGGTLFLDEVGDLSLDNQARILRVVEDGTFRPVGAREEHRVDIRIVAATNKNLAEAMRQGGFREDLYHRLNGFEIHVPPLRERAADIPLLARHFFALAAVQAKHPLRDIAPEALDFLRTRPWPGNVRELRNCIFRAVSRAARDRVSLEDVQEKGARAFALAAEAEPVLTLEEMEKRHIESILRRCGGNVSEAARVLGIGRSTLYRMLTEHRIVT